MTYSTNAKGSGQMHNIQLNFYEVNGWKLDLRTGLCLEMVTASRPHVAVWFGEAVPVA